MVVQESGSDELGVDYVGVQTWSAATPRRHSVSRRAAADFASTPEFGNGLSTLNRRGAHPLGAVDTARPTANRSTVVD